MTSSNNTIRIYNTLTRKKETFAPIAGNKVNIFVCGPTVYDYPHLGHAKTYTQFDFIVRYLRRRGYDVFYLQNFTDIDDKIIDRALSQDISPQELARRFEDVYLQDMQALRNTAVDRYARATDYIPQIVGQVQALLNKGYAYPTPDGLYFDLTRFAGYGKLSGRCELQQEDSVSRIDDCSDKKNWNDFCLWKLMKPGEPFWETEIGTGRPGWHIEDTAITEAFFGPQYDIHGGAIDLIFPHHEAEIAQMEAISGREPLVRYWLHTGFLNLNSEKMSKSKGNFTTIRETLAHYDYRVLRYFFLSAHYRTTLDFTPESLSQARAALKRIEEFAFKIERDWDDAEDAATVEAVRDEIYAWLNDDFDTPRAWAALFDFIRAQNAKGRSGRRTWALLDELNGLFDVLDLAPELPEQAILALIAEREHCRAQQDYARADAIRDQLQLQQIQLYDTPEGVKWRKII